VEAQFDRLGASSVELASVNGTVLLTMPSGLKAELEASTVHAVSAMTLAYASRNHRIVGLICTENWLAEELGSNSPCECTIEIIMPAITYA